LDDRGQPVVSFGDSPIDPFTLREVKDGRVFISWKGRQVMVLKGARAESFLKRIAGLDETGRQLAMAKITGNFKRGNEKGR
jgi:hypothetical protein